VTSPDHDRQTGSPGRTWDSPFLKPDPAPPPRGTPPGVRRVLVLVVALATVVAGWSLRDRVGLGPSRDVSLAPVAVTPVASGSLRAAAPDSARPAAAAPASDSVAADELLLIDPRQLVGTWHHGDARSQYGDSLVLELRADGDAASAERRYTLDRSGWHVARAARAGVWSVRYRASRPPQLCTAWRTPKATESCDSVELLDDSTDGRLLLRYAGRHWTRGRRPATPPGSRPTPPPRRR
jgi:hypothetical protein